MVLVFLGRLPQSARPESLRRSWWRMSSNTAGSRGRTRIARWRAYADFEATSSIRRSLCITAALSSDGDGSIIEFRSVVDAVRCAIEMQTGMVERNAGLPSERRIEFRVGVTLAMWSRE